MRKRNKILIFVLLLGSIAIVKISFAPILSLFTINFFPRIEKRGHLDETWEYAIVDNPDKYGKNKWEIGLIDNKINIYETATAPVVRVNVFKNINMDYTSMDDYYAHGGPEVFKKFIEEHNK